VEDLLSLSLDLLREHAPLVLFLVAVVETAPLLGALPGEVVLAAGGYLVQQGQLSAELAWASVLLGVLVGDHAGYLIGRMGGRRIVHRLPLGDALRRIEKLTLKFGGLVVLLGRFLGARGVVLLTVGTMGLPYRRFWPYELVGAATWSAWRLALGALGGLALDRLGALGPEYQWLFAATAAAAIFLVWRGRQRLRRVLWSRPGR
jgi:membrane protein DedA with SNARE-associated domain